MKSPVKSGGGCFNTLALCPARLHSPLYGLDLETLSSTDLIIASTIQARDHTPSEDVLDLRFYNVKRILAGMAHKDAIGFDEQGRPSADLSTISHIERDPVFSG
jgi:hypothetical protein